MVTVKPSPGRPAYKTPEEYYDEVLELRKVNNICLLFLIVIDKFQFTVLVVHVVQFNSCDFADLITNEVDD